VQDHEVVLRCAHSVFCARAADISNNQNCSICQSSAKQPRVLPRKMLEEREVRSKRALPAVIGDGITTAVPEADPELDQPEDPEDDAGEESDDEI
jgi:hypothetical protein